MLGLGIFPSISSCAVFQFKSDAGKRRSSFHAICIALLGAILFESGQPLHAQATVPTGQWIWIGGSNTIPNGSGPPNGPGEEGQPGVYGSPGVAAATNYPGGRTGQVGWTDSRGSFWLFGGWGYDATGNFGALNDLWEFNPGSKEWAWISGSNIVPATESGQSGVYGSLGVPDPANVPGGRAAMAAWLDQQGNLWIFGGQGFDAAGTQGLLNDLWQFSPAMGKWTWMGGAKLVPNSPTLAGGNPGVYGTQGIPAAGTVPGSRINPLAWVDHRGNLWLFGGDGYDAAGFNGTLDDLWEYSLSSHEWTWISGGSTLPTTGMYVGGLPGVYGTLGVSDPVNHPGSRAQSVGWTSVNGHFWLYGGAGYDSVGVSGSLQDLWKFDPENGQWTWMGGSSTLSPDIMNPGKSSGCPPAIRGQQGVPAPGNIPGCEIYATAWVDNSDHFWLFNGELWEFDPGTNEWAWMAASVANAVYGTLGVANATNNPSYRWGESGWTDSSGNPWLFGGIGVPAPQTQGYLNDLWEYQLPAVPAPAFSLPAGAYTAIQTLTITDTLDGSAIYYTTDGSPPTTGSTLYSGPISISASETVTAVAVSGGYTKSPATSATYSITLPPPAFTLQASPPSLTIGRGSAGTISLAITPQNGFSSPVSFSCSGLPAGTACSFSPSTVTPSGSAVASQLTIASQIQSASVPSGSFPFSRFTALAVLLYLAVGRRKRGIWHSYAPILILGCLGFINGCGGNNSTSKPVVATVTITATGGGVQETTSISLTVN